MALAPTIAKDMAFQPVAMLLSMQFATRIAPTFCPITAVVVAVAGFANISPFDLLRRTVVPGTGALITSLIVAALITV